jgi:hypothetical protein
VKLELLMLLSFCIILLFATYGKPAHAQLTKTLDVKITLAAAINNTTIRQEQHSNGSTPFVFASPSSSLKNPTSAVSTTSSFNNNHQSSQLPPIANAGPGQVVTAGSAVILNGSNSRAPNGIILSYSWMQLPASVTSLSGVNTPVWEFIAPKVTADTPLRFQLNITDNLGQMGTAFVNVVDKPASTFFAPPPTQIMKSPSISKHSFPKCYSELYILDIQ